MMTYEMQFALMKARDKFNINELLVQQMQVPVTVTICII